VSTEPPSPRTVINAENPWPGLSAFDEAAQRFFNGRDIESSELLRLVGQAPFSVLFGKSGLGKTSLVQAGLFPLLRKQNILPVYIRLDMRDRSEPLVHQITATLKAEVAKHGVDASMPANGESLWEYLHNRDVQWWSAKNQLLHPLFVFDQFEEAFTLGEDNAEAIATLRVALADLIENRIPSDLALRIDKGELTDHLDLRGQRYKVLLSFREDFLPEVEGWKCEMPSLMRNRLRLLPMSADHAVQVVSGHTPGGRAHELVSDETAKEIVRFVAAVQTNAEMTGKVKSIDAETHSVWDKLDIEPALLSLLCEGLNEKRKARAQPTIDATLLRETGNAIIGDFYQRCVRDVPDKTRRFIEDDLITEGGFRNSYPLQDALEQRVLSESLLRQLVDRRLLRIDHQMRTDRVELIHDRLTDVVREDRDRRRREADKRKADDERRQLEERNRRQRRMMALIGMIALLFFGLGAFAAWSWKKTQKALVETEEQAQIAYAASKEARDALMLAEEQTQLAEARLKSIKDVLESIPDKSLRDKLTRTHLPGSVKMLTKSQETRREIEIAKPRNAERARARNPKQYGLNLWENGATLRVRFISGTNKQHEAVTRIASEWTKYANVRFLFGSEKDSEVRITFDPAYGSWAFVGTDALGVLENQATMNLGFQDGGNILHEFGHVLGLIHENSSPNANLPWNKEAVYRDLGGPPNFFTKDQVDFNVFKQIKGIEYREFDPDSIMMFSYSASWFTDGQARGGKQVLSESDKQFIRKLYPPN
jgi:hypothetical protein